MSIKALSYALLILSLASVASSAEPALAGQWRVKSATLCGKPNPGQVGSIYEFDKDALVSFQRPGLKAMPASGRVDSTAKPWAVDVELDDDRPAVGGAGPRAGIIRLKEDIVTICVCGTAGVGEPRPERFESTEGQLTELVVLERVKK